MDHPVVQLPSVTVLKRWLQVPFRLVLKEIIENSSTAWWGALNTVFTIDRLSGRKKREAKAGHGPVETGAAGRADEDTSPISRTTHILPPPPRSVSCAILSSHPPLNCIHRRRAASIHSLALSSPHFAQPTQSVSQTTPFRDLFPRISIGFKVSQYLNSTTCTCVYPILFLLYRCGCNG